MEKAYLVEIPPSPPRVYDTWAEVQGAIRGRKGVKHMAVTSSDKAVTSHEHAKAIISADGVQLGPGRRYAFTDANAAGGVGIVIVDQGRDGKATSREWPPTTVQEIFEDSDITDLRTESEVSRALADLRNILAEMAGLYAVLRNEPEGSKLTVVYDYWGVERFMQGTGWKKAWKARNVIAAVVQACKDLIDERDFNVDFKYQVAHQKTIIGRDDFASWNGRADELATEALKS